MENQKNHRSSSVGTKRTRTPKRNKNIEMLPRRSERLAYTDKSLDMRVRLELWRAEKRKCEIGELGKVGKYRGANKKDGERQKSMLFGRGSRSVNRNLLKTPTKDFLSPPSKDTYKDTNLDMRTRLELWLNEKGKTPQKPRLSKRAGITPKTPCLTPNQRRKTWSFQKLNTTGGNTECRNLSKRGILKNPSLTAQKMRKSCSVLWHDKENMASNSTVENSSPIHNTLVLEEEDFLRCSLQKCNGMLNESFCKQEEVVFTLDDIQRDHPNALRHALYWICRAKLAEYDGDHERVVCMFEQAFAFSAQPEEVIENAFSDYKTRKQQKEQKENKSPVPDATYRTPRKTPSRELAGLDGEVFSSSVVRFCVMDSTPFRKRKSTSEIFVLTPVRRTTRWERCGITHPKTIVEKQVTVASLDELSTQLRSGLVFRPNSLLPCELDKEMQC